jgi:hypothetical protein
LLDTNSDGASDTLTNYRQLTPAGGVVAYGWHPDGTRLCYVQGNQLRWVDAASGNSTTIVLPDSTVSVIAAPSVYWQPGEHTLVAFQAQPEGENLRNIYVWDEQDNTLTRLLPFAMPVTHNLFPRWHPYRKSIVYVSDYTVAPWANTPNGS